MISLVLLVFIQITQLSRVLSEPMATAHKELDKYVDLIERNERQIHNGIASGRFDAEDRQDDEDTDEENYGKLLLQDMVNFHEVKVPGVDYEPVEPASTPIEVVELNEIDQEARPQPEGPLSEQDEPHQDEAPPEDYQPPQGEEPPQEQHQPFQEEGQPPEDYQSPQGENPSPPGQNQSPPEQYPLRSEQYPENRGPPDVESEDTPPVDYSTETPPRMHPREYSHESPPHSEETPESPEVDHHHHHHHHHHSRGHPSEDETPNPENNENLKHNENIHQNHENDGNMNEFERVRDPFPPITHSSYQDSANLNNHQNNNNNDNEGHPDGQHSDDQHSGTLPHSHPIDENNRNERTNEEEYHTHEEPNGPDGHLHPNEDPHHMHTNEPPISDPNDYNRDRPEKYENGNINVEPNTYSVPKAQHYSNVEKDTPITSAKNVDYNEHKSDYNPNPIPLPIPLNIIVDSNSDSEPKQNEDNQQNDMQSKPPGVGARGDQIMKYYEDQSKVDSKRHTRLAVSAPKEPKAGLKLVKREDSTRFDNYKNTNGPQIIDENKRINKRIGLPPNPQSEPHGYYYPIHKQSSPQYNGPTTGSREYQKKQEYHSYEPNTPMNDEELPSEELKKFYDQWADQPLKFSSDKFKKNDHLNEGRQTDSPKRHDYVRNDNNDRHHRHRDDHSEDDTDSGENSRPPNPEDYELSRPRNDVRLQKAHNPPHYHPHSPHAHPPHPHSHPHHHHHSSEKQQEPEQEQPEEEQQQEDNEEPHSHDNDDHSEQPEERPIHYPRYAANRSNPPKTERLVDDEEDYHSIRQDNNPEPHREQRHQNNDHKNRKNDNSNLKPDDNFEYDLIERQTTGKLSTFSHLPFNFESLIASDTSFLDALTPQNLSGIADNYQDYDNQNGQEMNENENQEQSRSEDDSHQSNGPSVDEDDQQEDEPQTKAQHSQHTPHSQHKQLSQRSHHSDPSQTYNSDKTSINANNNQNNDYSPNNDYYRQNTNSRHRQPNDHSVPNQRSNDNHYNHNDRKANSQQQRYEGDPRHRPYSGRRQQHYDEERAASADTSAQKADPNTGILVSDESQKILTQTNSSVNSDNNQTLSIRAIDSFNSWAKPLILKSRLIVVDDKNETQVLGKNELLTTNTNREEVKQRVATKRNSRNITRKPKLETKIRENSINSVDFSKTNQTYDMIINPNNKSEYQLKPSNPQTINQQMVRTIRTRPQRSISDNIINFERNADHLNDNQLAQNSQNSWTNILPNIWTHVRNRSSESSISQPNCAQRSPIKDFCLALDEEYPLESIRQNLIRNLENLRSVHRRLNPSVTNDRYYEDSAESLDNSCKTHKLTIRPLRAKNINGEWKVIANIPHLFEQSIALTNCSEVHKDCETNDRKYFSKCVQKYSLNDLITYNSESSDFEIDIFLAPNVCSCSAPKTNII